MVIAPPIEPMLAKLVDDIPEAAGLRACGTRVPSVEARVEFLLLMLTS